MSRSADDPPPLPKDRPRAGAVRARLMLEIASELVGRPDWTARQARVTLRSQGGSNWEPTLFGSDSVLVAPEVASGEVTFAIVNPATAIDPRYAGSRRSDMRSTSLRSQRSRRTISWDSPSRIVTASRAST